MTADVSVLAWEVELEDLLLRIGARFARVQPRRRMRDYVRGLLGPVARKDSWQPAEHAGHATPHGLQRLLSWCQWDPDEVRDDLQDYVAEHPGAPDGVLVIDDTGFVKKGTVSAGVQRQYSGTAGRTENCQIGVFAAYASGRGRALVDRELYLPKSWTDDVERCRKARVPEQRGFATKSELARPMILRALASELPIAWVTADSAYGQEWRFRRFREETGLGYVLAVPKSQPVHLAGRIDDLFSQAPDQAWEKISCGDGAKGPREYDWAALQLAVIPDFDGDQPSHQRWALARRSLTRPDEVAYYLAYAPTGSTVVELVRVAGRRSAIEECFQAAKNECGLDQYEVRRYVGDGRHRRGKGGRRTDSGTLAPLTVAEVRRLPAALAPPQVPRRKACERALNWSRWRRRHQAGARRCHYQRRTAARSPGGPRECPAEHPSAH